MREVTHRELKEEEDEGETAEGLVAIERGCCAGLCSGRDAESEDEEGEGGGEIELKEEGSSVFRR